MRKFNLGDSVSYSGIYVLNPYSKLPEEEEEPIHRPRRIKKEVQRGGIVCGIRRISLSTKFYFYDSGNNEYDRDYWEAAPENFKMVYLIAPNMTQLDRVDEAWMVLA